MQLTLKVSLKMTGGNVRQLLEGDCVTPELQYTILLLLGTATTTSMASLTSPVERTPCVKQCSSHFIRIMSLFNPPNKPMKYILPSSSPIHR